VRQLGSLILVVVVVLGLAGPALSQEDPTDCQYVLVVDEARKGVRILNVGEDAITGGVGLEADEAGDFAPLGVDFTTVPEYSDARAFVAQGPFLRVIDLTRWKPLFTLDVEGEFGLAGIRLTRLDAAEPVSVGSEIRYPLYATGSRAGTPWVLVLDQEALMASSTLSSALLAAGPVHADCEDCAGVGLDIAAGGPAASGGIQEAYVSVLDDSDAAQWLRIYRLVLHDDFSFSVSLDPWGDESLPFDGSAPRANGLDYDGTGTQPFGVFQTTAVVKDLSNGESSCSLSGHPNDVAVWGPVSEMEHPDFLFVTSVTPLGSDLILGFPAGGCPDGGAASLSFPVSGFPRALALNSVTSRTPWIYSAHRYGQISALNVRLSTDGETGDRIDVLESLVILVDGGPAAVAIRDESHHECLDLGSWMPAQEARPPKVDCLEDPDDPRCAKRVAFEPSDGTD